MVLNKPLKHSLRKIHNILYYNDDQHKILFISWPPFQFIDWQLKVLTSIFTSVFLASIYQINTTLISVYQESYTFCLIFTLDLQIPFLNTVWNVTGFRNKAMSRSISQLSINQYVVSVNLNWQRSIATKYLIYSMPALKVHL